MKEILKLESEIHLLKDNIDRLKIFVDEYKNDSYRPYTSGVFGELKHRAVSLRNTLSRINKMNTNQLFEP